MLVSLNYQVFTIRFLLFLACITLNSSSFCYSGSLSSHIFNTNSYRGLEFSRRSYKGVVLIYPHSSYLQQNHLWAGVFIWNYMLVRCLVGLGFWIWFGGLGWVISFVSRGRAGSLPYGVLLGLFVEEMRRESIFREGFIIRRSLFLQDRPSSHYTLVSIVSSSPSNTTPQSGTPAVSLVEQLSASVPPYAPHFKVVTCTFFHFPGWVLCLAWVLQSRVYTYHCHGVSGSKLGQITGI